MRENRPYGSEGGEGNSFPTPINLKRRTQTRNASACLGRTRNRSRRKSRMRSEDVVAGPAPPFAGAEYLESLRDGREVYIYGEKVADITTHPAFRNAARTIAKLYDSLHDPKMKDVLTCPTDTGNGGHTHRFFRVARTREDLIAQRGAIAAWARMSYGWMGRTPDYKASLMNTLGANHAFYDKFAANAQNWHRRGEKHVVFMNQANG